VTDWYEDGPDDTDDASGIEKDDRFEWDEGNLEHFVNNHGVLPEEAQEAVLDPRRIGTDAYNSKTERRWAVIGATEAGRVLFVVFTRRSGRIRIISAWDADESDRRRYWRR
jgi:uncharacterized DUF497 family protein